MSAWQSLIGFWSVYLQTVWLQATHFCRYRPFRQVIQTPTRFNMKRFVSKILRFNPQSTCHLRYPFLRYPPAYSLSYIIARTWIQRGHPHTGITDLIRWLSNTQSWSIVLSIRDQTMDVIRSAPLGLITTRLLFIPFLNWKYGRKQETYDPWARPTPAWFPTNILYTPMDTRLLLF